MTHYTIRENTILGHYKRRGMLRYKVESAYYHSACGSTINVICPNCKYQSEQHHGDITFRQNTQDLQRHDNYTWTQLICPKCDYVMWVIYR